MDVGATLRNLRSCGDVGLVLLETMMQLAFIVIGSLLLGDATTAEIGWAAFFLVGAMS